MKIKGILLTINHTYAFFGATLYCGVLWSLHFFWYPTWRNLQVSNYYEQFIPQTDAATKFFTVVVPLMFLTLLIMVVTEWKGRVRWVPIAALLLLVAATYVGQAHIIPINKILAKHVTDQAQLTSYLEKWISLNEIRWVLTTLLWLVMMLYFILKGEIVQKLSGETR
jgi:hypothetical protein